MCLSEENAATVTTLKTRALPRIPKRSFKSKKLRSAAGRPRLDLPHTSKDDER